MPASPPLPGELEGAGPLKFSLYLLRKSTMPQSRKRPGHHPHHKPADIPPKQRTKGRVIFALLFGAFGFIIALFAFDGYAGMIGGILVGATIGYFVGKQMEEAARQ